jgi:homoserine kinase
MRFQVPASTTNLGHGFDCFGVALNASNQISARIVETAGDDTLSQMVESCRAYCAQRWGKTVPFLKISISGDVPIARGMGSSSTIYAAAIAACQISSGSSLDLDEIIRCGSELEGHPDNICAAVLGGFTIIASVNGQLQWLRFPVPASLQAVISIPNFEVKTSEARKVLPQQFSKAEGIMAIQRCSMISAAMVSGQIDRLHGLFNDAWHEHYRASLNPGLHICRDAAESAGAIATFLSGSGSCILSLCTRDTAATIHSALQKAYGNIAEIRIIDFNNNGLVQLP